MVRGGLVNNKRIIPINLINLIVIISIMLVVAILTNNIMKELTIRDIQNVTRLTQTNIYSEIVNELVEPVNTSIIMANNTYLFEMMNEDTPETEEKIAKYLTAIQKATGYESVFLIPHETLSYYHPGGTDAKVDLESDESFWYKDIMGSENDYTVLVNTEQLADSALTFYIDASMKDENGKFSGVTGVGKRITHFQRILSLYSSHGVEAYIINGDGLIQMHDKSELVKTTNFYDLEGISQEELTISESDDVAIEKQVDDNFIILHHIPILDWYLVVTKSTSEITITLNNYKTQILSALFIAALIMLSGTSFTISRYKKQIIKLSNTDQLTSIPNRTIFDNLLKDLIKNLSKERFCLALFDLDNLKIINDNLGHDQGDNALRTIANIAGEQFADIGLVSRVGGDEFAVILYKPIDEAEVILEKFRTTVYDNPELKSVGATVSIGLTEAKVTDNESTVYKRTDEALYNSKKSGRNSINKLL